MSRRQSLTPSTRRENHKRIWKLHFSFTCYPSTNRQRRMDGWTDRQMDGWTNYDPFGFSYIYYWLSTDIVDLSLL
ncbi:hypothetical protein ILYODFUR_012325 [Ilyodon furcidens]|uniref:Uncharacterized protein n=1 Tax=Ilyodon furcidens TaxID=33524 RepID=A0ABV0TY49_9TELE